MVVRGATTERRFVGRITMFFLRALGVWRASSSLGLLAFDYFAALDRELRTTSILDLSLDLQAIPMHSIEIRAVVSLDFGSWRQDFTANPKIPLHIFSSPRVFLFARRIRIGSSGLPLIACWFATERIGIPAFLPMTGRCFAYQSITLRNSKA